MVNGRILAKISSLRISSFITNFAIVLIMAVTNNVLVSYGEKSIYGADIPLTTVGITMKVNQIITAIIMGLTTGAQPIYGYNYGCGQKDRVRQIIYLIPTTLLLPITLGVDGVLWAGPVANFLAFITTLVIILEKIIGGLIIV